MRINELAKEHATELDALIDGALMLDSQNFGLNCDKEMGAVFYYPISIGNPFQSLYYSKFMENGIIPIGTNNLSNVASNSVARETIITSSLVGKHNWRYRK